MFLKELIKIRLNRLTLQEILYYSSQYGFSLTPQEGKQIITYIQNNEIDPFDPQKREKIFYDLSQLTNPETATKARHLFEQLIAEYGLEDLFY